MKYYVIADVNTKTGDDFTEFEGANLNEALKAKEKALANYDKYLTESEKAHRIIECRVVDIPDDTNINDKNELSNAVCDALCIGWDEF